MYRNKYLKYKNKYLNLKNNIGGKILTFSNKKNVSKDINNFLTIPYL